MRIVNAEGARAWSSTMAWSTWPPLPTSVLRRRSGDLRTLDRIHGLGRRSGTSGDHAVGLGHARISRAATSAGFRHRLELRRPRQGIGYGLFRGLPCRLQQILLGRHRPVGGHRTGAGFGRLGDRAGRGDRRTGPAGRPGRCLAARRRSDDGSGPVRTGIAIAAAQSAIQSGQIFSRVCPDGSGASHPTSSPTETTSKSVARSTERRCRTAGRAT